MNTKYVENLRHTLSHLMAGLSAEMSGDSARLCEAQEQYVHARKHLADLDVNGYEFLAGHLLTRLRQRLETAGFFIVADKAENLREEALRHFDKGREWRTRDKYKGMEHFERSIELSQQAMSEIAPSSKMEKRMLRITISMLVAIFK